MAHVTVDPQARKTLTESAAEYEDLAKLVTVQKSGELSKKVKDRLAHIFR